MGWAKYTEDNNEIIFERAMIFEEKTCGTEIKVSFSYKTPDISVNSSENAAVKKRDFANKKIICKDCGQAFNFSAKSQMYFKKQGWNQPKRCKHCREHRNTIFLMCTSY